MKKTIFLHVGFHKTGTSSIQFYLHNNRTALKKTGLIYPKSVLNGNNHSILANSIKSIYRDQKPNPHYKRLKEEIENIDGDVIISSECFMEELDPKLIKDSFRDFDDTIKIVFYVRPQVQWIESLYGEVIKDSSRRYTGRIEYIREVRNGKLNYFNVIENWRNTFQKENIIVREFKQWEHSNDLITDFLDTVTRTDNAPKLKIKRAPIKNPRFDPRCLEFLRRINMVAMPRELHIQLVSELAKLSNEIESTLGKRTFRLITQDEVKRLELRWNQNIGHPNSRILSTGGTLLFNNDSISSFPENYDELTVHEEHWVFDHLSRPLQNHLSKASIHIRTRHPNNSFIPIPPADEINRLRAMVGRLRAELNWIYM